MIILDTNVVSALIDRAVYPHVTKWADGQRRVELRITATTAAELEFGAALLPLGRRKRCLQEAVVVLLDVKFAGRILAFDRGAARHYADIASNRQATGHRISVPDGQIAAICRARGATLATRNVEDFEGTGIELINPWD